MHKLPHKTQLTVSRRRTRICGNKYASRSLFCERFSASVLTPCLQSETFFAIVIGNVLGCALMYFGNELITRYVDRDNPMLLVGGIAVIGTMILLLNIAIASSRPDKRQRSSDIRQPFHHGVRLDVSPPCVDALATEG